MPNENDIETHINSQKRFGDHPAVTIDDT